MRFDQSKILWRSSWGTPISSAMACSGSSEAMSTTKSHSPRIDDVVDDQARLGAQPFFEKADHARCEALVDEEPVPRVPRRIHVQHHLAHHVDVVVDVGDADAVLGRAEDLVVAIDGDQIGVASDAPETGAVGLGVEVHRRLAAQHLEHLVVPALFEDVRIEQVDVAQLHRGPPSRPRPGGRGAQTRTDSSFLIGASAQPHEDGS